jgi:MFS family permease
MAFLAEAAILPVMVKSLHGPLWLMTVIPVLMSVGAQLPSLLVAHWIEKLHWVKPLVMITGVFQRLPYLLTGLALIYLAPFHPSVALVAVALCPLISGLACGVSLSAWQELVAKTIPANRRSSLWAVRSTIAAGIGSLAGACVFAVLSRCPGTTGYGILHLIVLAFLTASYVIFSTILETDLPARPDRHTPTLLVNLRAVPSLVAGNRQFRRYLAAQAFSSGLIIVMPFMAVHGLGVLRKPDSFAGILLSAQMIGGVVGNVMAGFLGDRIGGRIVVLLSRMALCGLCVGMVFGSDLWHFLAAFAVLGMAMSFNNVGAATLALEVCPLQKRATYLSILSATGVVTTLSASGLGAAAWKCSSGRFGLVAALAAATFAASVFFIWRLEEPRKEAVGEIIRPPV